MARQHFESVKHNGRKRKGFCLIANGVLSLGNVGIPNLAMDNPGSNFPLNNSKTSSASNRREKGKSFNYSEFAALARAGEETSLIREAFESSKKNATPEPIRTPPLVTKDLVSKLSLSFESPSEDPQKKPPSSLVPLSPSSDTRICVKDRLSKFQANTGGQTEGTEKSRTVNSEPLRKSVRQRVAELDKGIVTQTDSSSSSSSSSSSCSDELSDGTDSDKDKESDRGSSTGFEYADADISERPSPLFINPDQSLSDAQLDSVEFFHIEEPPSIENSDNVILVLNSVPDAEDIDGDNNSRSGSGDVETVQNIDGDKNNNDNNSDSSGNNQSVMNVLGNSQMNPLSNIDINNINNINHNNKNNLVKDPIIIATGTVRSDDANLQNNPKSQNPDSHSSASNNNSVENIKNNSSDKNNINNNILDKNNMNNNILDKNNINNNISDKNNINNNILDKNNINNNILDKNNINNNISDKNNIYNNSNSVVACRPVDILQITTTKEETKEPKGDPHSKIKIANQFQTPVNTKGRCCNFFVNCKTKPCGNFSTSDFCRRLFCRKN